MGVEAGGIRPRDTTCTIRYKVCSYACLFIYQIGIWSSVGVVTCLWVVGWKLSFIGGRVEVVVCRW